jgi:hypothetical protein
VTHLRLVKEEATKPSRRRDVGRRQLTDDQIRQVRLAVRNLVRAYGSVPCLAEVTGLAPATIYELRKRRDKDRPGLLIATRVARAAGMTVEQLLAGRLIDTSACPACGVKKAS